MPDTLTFPDVEVAGCRPVVPKAMLLTPVFVMVLLGHVPVMFMPVPAVMAGAAVPVPPEVVPSSPDMLGVVVEFVTVRPLREVDTLVTPVAPPLADMVPPDMVMLVPAVTTVPFAARSWDAVPLLRTKPLDFILPFALRAKDCAVGCVRGFDTRGSPAINNVAASLLDRL